MSSPLTIHGQPITAALLARYLVAAIALAGPGAILAAAGGLDDPTSSHGDMIVRDDAGVARVPVGTVGQVLTVGDAGLPVWRAVSSGSSLPDAAGVADGAVLAAVGGAQAWVGPPTTLAAQARLEAQRRRGPLAMVFPSTSDYVRSLSTDSPSTPAVGLSTSGVLVVRSTQAGSYPSSFLLFSGVNATRGYFFAISAGSGGARLLIRSMSSGGNVDAFVPDFVSTTGWHAVAWSIPADGLSLRYSLDGASAATVTPGTTPWPWTARLTTDPVLIGTDGTTAGSALPLAYAAIWSSVLSDADLVTLSASPSAGAPTLPSTPAWEWAAAAHSGAQSITIGGARYDTTGSPRVWMP